MATDTKDKGFTLPNPDAGKASLPSTMPALPGMKTPDAPGLATSPKALMIGAGVLVVVLILFFLLKGMYANYLVSKKVSPAKANQAGWWLWVFLSALAAAAIFAIVDQTRFMSMVYIAPLGLVAIAALVLMLLSARR